MTPKAKGMLSEDHPLYFGVCAGVAGDWAILEFFEKADLLLGIGFEPVESDRLWHKTMRLVSVSPVSIADMSVSSAFRGRRDGQHHAGAAWHPAARAFRMV